MSKHPLQENLYTYDFELFLLGAPQIFQRGKSLTSHLSRRAQALLFFLVIENKTYSRTYLASLFWPDLPDVQAKKNLRNILPELRKVFGNYLRIDATSVSFQLQDTVWCDLFSLQKLLNEVESDAALSQIEALLTLYRGELLTGFFVSSAPFFEEWLTIERQRAAEFVRTKLYSLAQRLFATQHVDIGIRVTRRLLECDPWNEEIHRLLMRFLAQCGQKNAALLHFEQLQKLLMTEFGASPDAETQLLLESIRKGEPQPAGEIRSSHSFPIKKNADKPAPQAQERKHNLPGQLTSFVGRLQEVEELCRLLLDSNRRLITVSGMGGIGKTRLVLAVAHLWIEDAVPCLGNAEYQGHADAGNLLAGVSSSVDSARFQDGIYFVALAGVLADGNLVENLAIAITDSLQLPRNSQLDPTSELLSELRNKDMLLILDNFEHLVSGVDFLLEILRHAPNLTILVTSRTILDVQAEHIYWLTGLALPPLNPDPHLIPREATSYAAVELFLERLQRRVTALSLSPEELTCILHVCHFVEGMPLAIELAAAMTRFHTCQEIWEKLSQGAIVLASNYRDIPSRHRSLDAVFDYSWQMLTQAQRHLLSICALFPKTFAAHAAATIAAVPSEQLYLLADASLLKLLDGRRFEMHPLVQRYALEKLQAQPEMLASAQQRFAHYYANLIESDGHELLRSTAKFQLLQRELINVHRSWHFAVQHRCLDELKKMGEGVMLCCLFQGPLHEGLQLLHLGIEAVCDDEPEALDAQSFNLYGSLLTGQLFLLVFQSEDAKFAELLHKTLPVVERMNERRLLSLVHFAMAWDAYSHSDLEAHHRHHEIGMQHAQACGYHCMVAVHLAHLALGVALQGRISQALDLLHQGFQILHTYGYELLNGYLLSELSFVYMLAGELTLAFDTTEQAFQANQAINSTLNASWMFERMALFSESAGNYPQALIWAERAVSQNILIQNLESLSCALLVRGRARLVLGDIPAAQADFSQALEISARKKLSMPTIQAHIELGNLLSYRNDWRAAEEEYRAALLLLAGNLIYTAAVEGGLAKALLEQGQLNEAFSHADSAASVLLTHPLLTQYDVVGTLLRTFNVLCTAQDARHRPLLQRGLEYLLDRSEKITEEEMRRAFLENIPAHKFLLELAKEHRIGVS